MADLTDVYSQVTDRWEEYFDIRASDEFRIHSSSVFEQGTSKQVFGTIQGTAKSDSMLQTTSFRNDSHSKALCDTRKVPDGFNSSFTDNDLNARIRGAHRPVCVMHRLTLDENLAVNRQFTLPRSFVNFT